MHIIAATGAKGNHNITPNQKYTLLADGITKKHSKKEIHGEILLLIHMLNEDLDTEIVMRESFEKVKNNGSESPENFMDLLVAEEYQTIYENYK